MKNSYRNDSSAQGRVVKNFYLVLIVLLFAGCTTVQFVSPYDEVIDIGLKEYKESINTLAKDLADNAGKNEGTYEENVEKYNSLESKIDLLIDRASIQSAGRGCKLSVSLAARVSEIMGDDLPPEGIKNEDGDSYGCTERLLTMIREQLDSLQMIHETTDKCREIGLTQEDRAEPKNISCLRPATSRTAMRITNQSINAAWVVETAKKSEGGE